MRRFNKTGLVAIFLLAACAADATQALAVAHSPRWSISSLAQPTNLSPADNAGCEASQHCDSYSLVVRNVGAATSDGSTITIRDTLPPGVTAVAVKARDLSKTVIEEAFHEFLETKNIECSIGPVVCTYPEPVAAGGILELRINVTVAAEPAATVENHASVEGGGAEAMQTKAPTTAPNTLNDVPPGFGIQDFGLEPHEADGTAARQAGGHPDSLTNSYDMNSLISPEGESDYSYTAVEQPKTISVLLPPGLVGNPLAVPQCPESDLNGEEAGCPADTRVGTITLNRRGHYEFSGVSRRFPFGAPEVSDVYNMVPEAGYPAMLGFRVTNASILLYASVVPAADGYRVRITAPDVPHFAGHNVDGAIINLYGFPGAHDGGSGAGTPFLRNPTDCAASAADLTATMEADSWVNPALVQSAQAPAYPAIEGCESLHFEPTASVAPETTAADTPSGYEVDVRIPQAPAGENVPATPDLKSATVTLPEGVVLSPSGASGLEGCTPEAIDQAGVSASESGVPLPSVGHCPPGSTIGTVEVETPLLPPHTVTGHLYLAEPRCGAAGQPACTPSSAEDGELFGTYIELAGDGVRVKLKGDLSVNPSTGQITARFDDDPQFPVSEIRVRLNGGQRAPLANPQSCGPVASLVTLTPWSAPQTPTATSTSTFSVTGCASSPSFSPRFSAGTVLPQAGRYSSFTMTLTRKDGEQNLGGVSLTMPPGVSGMLAKVPLCGEPQASLGTCSEGSKIGTVNAAAGAGSEPLWLPGRVYLTGPYKGAPFGLSIVVPAKAGPFNLGNVVERAAIKIDPHTAQVTVTDGPLQQSRDGVPFRLKTLNVTIDREGFIFNPTNCSQLHVTGTVSGVMPSTGAPGSSVAVSSPFAVAGCKNLPFKPSFSALTQANHSRNGGAYLHVVVKSGAGQANIGSVKVDLPKVLPSRLSTLKLACTEAQFASNPAGCPAGSKVGSATAYTPVLPVALTGPAYFVSHGGAKFPELVVVLEGDNVTLDLAGETFISSKGITSSTFRSVPDVPITRFDLVLPTGAHSALAGNGSFCKGAMYMPTQIKGQNGAVLKQSTKIAVTGCKPAIRVVGHSVKGSHASIRVTVPSAGTLVATGPGITRSVRGVAKAGTVTIGVTLSSHALRVLAKNPHQRVNAKVKLRFSPKHGAPLTAYVTLLMG